MSLRIGERDRSPAATPVRPSAAAARPKTALAEVGRARSSDDPEAGVVIRLSPDAQRLLARGDEDATSTEDSDSATRAADAAGGAPDGESAGDKGKSTAAGPKQLSNEQKQVVSRLSARDTAVRAHEAAHQAAAGGLAGGASFSYETGPDGRRYAVGGEVPVSLRPGRTPHETIANAQAVRSAALAPADPSSQDMAVAAQATQMEAEAQRQVTESKAHGGDGNDAEGDVPIKRAGKSHEAGRSQGAAAGDRADAVATAIPGDGGGAGDRVAAKDQAGKADDHDRDSLMIFSTLKAERGTTINGHAHAAGGSGGCAICLRAASRYTQISA